MKRLFLFAMAVSLLAFGCSTPDFTKTSGPPAIPPPPRCTDAEIAAGTSEVYCTPNPKIIADNYSGATAEVSDAAVGAAGNGDTVHAYSKDDIHDYAIIGDTDLDGLPDALDTDAVDVITEIAAALKAGSDTTLLTGTAGTATYTAVWNADGDLVDGYDPATYLPLASTSTTPLTGPLFITEQADANADVAGLGQLWVNTATPNELWFTDDAGTDHQLGVGGGVTPSGSNNQVITDDGSSGIVSEANLTFNGSTLAVTGAATISTTLGVTGNITTNANILSPNSLTIYTTGPSDDIVIDANGGGAADIALGVTGDSDTIHTYGLVTMDTIPVGPASDPTTDNQFARKAYVDSVAAGGGLPTTGGTMTGNITMDDGTTDSPSIIFTDETDETATFTKTDSGYLGLTTVAADGFNILVGNLKIGNGTPGQTLNGEDAYIEGLVEIDGVLYPDGGINGYLPSINEDNMASDSEAYVPTQQSVKAYVDGLVGAPTNITPVDTADENATFYPVLVDGATGSQATETDAGLSYNPSTNILSAGGYSTAASSTPTFILSDADDAAGTAGFFANSSGGANDVILTVGVEDSTGESTPYIEVDGVSETIDFLKPITLSSQVITDNAIVTVDQADAADNDFAKFTANGLEGRSYSEVISDLSLTALATTTPGTGVATFLATPTIANYFTAVTGEGAFAPTLMGYATAAAAFTGIKQTATTSATGVSELATTAETTTGTDAARVVTPDGLSGSVYGQKEIGWTIYDSDTATAVADGLQAAVIPASMNGMNLMDVTCSIANLNSASGGATTVVLRRVRAGTPQDMTSTGVTIGYNAYTASDETVNTSYDDVVTGDSIYVDVNAVTTGAAQLGLSCTAVFQTP